MERAPTNQSCNGDPITSGLQDISMIVRFFINRWDELLNQIKTVSTISPNRIIAANGPLTLSDYISMILMPTLNTLRSDYEQFLMLMFPVEEDTSYLAMLARYAFATVWKALVRLIYALRNFSKFSSAVKPDGPLFEYFTTLLIPPKHIYHPNWLNENEEENKESRAFLVADLPHLIYKDSLRYYMQEALLDDKTHNRHTETITTSKNNKSGVEQQMPITLLTTFSSSTNPFNIDNVNMSDKGTINRYLSLLSTIESYPIIPDNCGGVILSTSTESTVENNDYKLLEPGADSRCRVQQTTDARICINCKLRNTVVGQTDEREQRERIPCTCVYSFSNNITAGCGSSASASSESNGHDQDIAKAQYKARATAIIRTILSFSNKHTCKHCTDHAPVFIHTLKNVKSCLDKMHLFQYRPYNIQESI